MCSHTFITTRSAAWCEASAAAQVNAVRLPGDPSTPTTMVFHCLTVASSRGAAVPAGERPAGEGSALAVGAGAPRMTAFSRARHPETPVLRRLRDVPGG